MPSKKLQQQNNNLMKLSTKSKSICKKSKKIKNIDDKSSPTKKLTQSQKTRLNKKQSIDFCNSILEYVGGDHTAYHESKKKDDLADSFLQGIYALKQQRARNRRGQCVLSFDIGTRNMAYCVVQENVLPNTNTNNIDTDNENCNIVDVDDRILAGKSELIFDDSKDISILRQEWQKYSILAWEKYDVLEECGCKITNSRKLSHERLVSYALRSLIERRKQLFEKFNVDTVVIEIQPRRAGDTKAIAWSLFSAFYTLELNEKRENPKKKQRSIMLFSGKLKLRLARKIV